MKEMSMGWRSFLARLAVTAAVLGVVIFAAVRGAMARPGTPGGAARSFVTIAGTVTGVPAGTVPMQFTFRRQVTGDGGVREERCVRSVPVEVDGAGSFAAEVPLDVPAPACEESFFDGTDVVVDVAVNGTQVVDGGAVNPVPYSIHATNASAAAAGSGLERQLATAAASVPPGTIVAFGGERVPDGWLLCDGHAVSRVGVYSALFDAVRTAWGAGDGTTTFHLPDLRGRFLRGVDGDAGVDPERDARVPAHDGGAIGNHVGTTQGDQFRAHRHPLGLFDGSNAPGSVSEVARFNPFGGAPLFRYLSDEAGGSETRPVNAAVNFIIRY